MQSALRGVKLDTSGTIIEAILLNANLEGVKLGKDPTAHDC